MEMENGRGDVSSLPGSGRGLRLSETLGSDADRVGPAGLLFLFFLGYDTKLEEEACRNKWRCWLLAKGLGH
jgi:hypothetical protein